MDWISIVILVFFVLYASICVLITLVGLPGTWLMVAGALVITLCNPLWSDTLIWGWVTIGVVLGLAVCGEILETLAAGQALAELCLLLVANSDPLPGMLSTVLIHLERLEEKGMKGELNPVITLAKSVQSCVHLLALGGYGLPIQRCCQSHLPLDPPIGEWDWRCSLIPEEGFAIGAIPNAEIQLNPSELALLQRLLQPNLPIRSDGELMGPKEVWMRLLTVVEYWINNHLPKNLCALKMLRESLLN